MSKSTVQPPAADPVQARPLAGLGFAIIAIVAELIIGTVCSVLADQRGVRRSRSMSTGSLHPPGRGDDTCGRGSEARPSWPRRSAPLSILARCRGARPSLWRGGLRVIFLIGEILSGS